MRCASIDVGTNTILMLIADVDIDVRKIDDIASITRLGEGLGQSGCLSDDAMNRAVETLKRYRTVAAAQGVERFFCVGTSALRDAQNRALFLERVKAECAIVIDVISGLQEARYAYSSVRDDKVIAGDRLLVVDIGGGSTEIIVGDAGGLIDAVSLPVGSVRLTEMFVRHDPPMSGEMNALRRHVRSLLGTVLMDGRGCTLVGTGATMTNLAGLKMGLTGFDDARIHGYVLTANDVVSICAELALLTTAERGLLRGMERGREDVILQGATLLSEIIAHFRKVRCTVSTKGVRYGVLNVLSGNPRLIRERGM